MKSHIRHLLDEVLAGRSLSSQQDRPPRSRRGRKISRLARGKGVGQNRKGNGLLGIAIDADVFMCQDRNGGQLFAEETHQDGIPGTTATDDYLIRHSG